MDEPMAKSFSSAGSIYRAQFAAPQVKWSVRLEEQYREIQELRERVREVEALGQQTVRSSTHNFTKRSWRRSS